MIKKILKISVWVLTIAAIVCLWYFIHKDHVENPLRRVDMTIEQPKGGGFIDSLTLYHDIMSICDTAKNTDITMIPVDSIRAYLKSIPWLVYSSAEMTLDEVLIVKVVECEPIMRVYNKNGQSVYLDEEGRIFPISKNHPLHLLVGSGAVRFLAVTSGGASLNDSIYAVSDLPMMFDVMRKIQNNSYSNCCVKQVYYDGKNFELVLNNVDVRVILGDTCYMDMKLQNLEDFFTHMQGSPALANYKSINFNFENQVVCTKKNKK